MKSYKTIFFFLTENEQYSILKAIENRFAIYYVKCGNHDTDKIAAYNSIDKFFPMISPNHGEHGYASWLILPRNTNFFAEKAHVSGEEKMTVYPLHGNEKAVVYDPGGIYKESNVIHGQFYILSDNSEMTEVFKHIKAEIKKISIKKDGYFVGKEIYNNKDNFERLITISIKSPMEYDLKILSVKKTAQNNFCSFSPDEPDLRVTVSIIHIDKERSF